MPSSFLEPVSLSSVTLALVSLPRSSPPLPSPVLAPGESWQGGVAGTAWVWGLYPAGCPPRPAPAHQAGLTFWSRRLFGGADSSRVVGGVEPSVGAKDGEPSPGTLLCVLRLDPPGLWAGSPGPGELSGLCAEFQPSPHSALPLTWLRLSSDSVLWEDLHRDPAPGVHRGV